VEHSFTEILEAARNLGNPGVTVVTMAIIIVWLARQAIRLKRDFDQARLDSAAGFITLLDQVRKYRPNVNDREYDREYSEYKVIKKEVYRRLDIEYLYSFEFRSDKDDPSVNLIDASRQLERQAPHLRHEYYEEYYEQFDKKTLRELIVKYGSIRGIWYWSYTRQFIFALAGAFTWTCLLIALNIAAMRLLDLNINIYGYYSYFFGGSASIFLSKVTAMVILSAGISIIVYRKPAARTLDQPQLHLGHESPVTVTPRDNKDGERRLRIFYFRSGFFVSVFLWVLVSALGATIGISITK
jgi:hypothetical protein